VNLGILATKGSLYVTRPTLGTHVSTLEAMTAAADEMFGLVADKKLDIAIGQRFALEDAGKAHTALASRKTTGATILTLD
jgi:NADPH2:quinone reductase